MRTLRHTIMATAFAAAAIFVIAPAMADAVKVGGPKGDYNLHFAPQVQEILHNNWIDYNVETGAGTPESMDWLLEHPTGVALLQGNAFAELSKDPKYAAIRVIRGDVAAEVVIGVMGEKAFKRTGGSWAGLMKFAARVNFVTSSEQSGPGATFKQLMALDPQGLGKATHVTYADDMDKALAMVANGQADVALMVQFANSENPRFKYVKKQGLHIAPVVYKAMRQAKMPDGSNAFQLCQGVDVGASKPIDTACSPVLYATGPAQEDDAVYAAVKSASVDEFLPKEGWFASLLKKMTRATTGAFDAAIEFAEEQANKIDVTNF